MQLVRYLGPTNPEAGSVLTAKELTDSGDVVRRNTLRLRTEMELDGKEVLDEQVRFDAKVHKRLGDQFSNEQDFQVALNFSSFSHDLVMYDNDDHQGTVLFDDQVSSYEPEVLDGHLTAQVLLP
jgi:hypothetical protein